VEIRERRPEDERSLEAFVARHQLRRVARFGELLDPLDYSALVVDDNGRVAGLLTYTVDPDQCEILTLHVDAQWLGMGTRLLAAVEEVARSSGCERMIVVTTNDNVDALRFYQRRGFSLAALHTGAVDKSRMLLKPEIPKLGEYEIPLRDELELHKDLSAH
jgi:N-acetylglutamate synthase-like GNAT family acetyltransferase